MVLDHRAEARVAGGVEVQDGVRLAVECLEEGCELGLGDGLAENGRGETHSDLVRVRVGGARGEGGMSREEMGEELRWTSGIQEERK